MKIIKTYSELEQVIKVREEKIVIVEGLAEEINDKFTSDDPRIYGAIDETISLPGTLVNMLFGSVNIFNTLLLIKKEYDFDYNEDSNQVFLILKDEFKRK